MIDWKSVQTRLRQLGFDPGPIDGIPGPRTEAAIVAFKRSRGLRARPYVGPVTLKALFGFPAMAKAATFDAGVPWMNEAAKHLGLHEARDFARLAAWLRSDGKTLGDPRKLPWCGDFVDTALRLTLPGEPRPGALGVNPYLARNWLLLGDATPLAFGAIIVFWRGRRDGISGHVGFAVAFDAKRGRILVRGGNQSNSASDAWLDADRMLGARKPATFDRDLPPLPGLSSAGAQLSTNEA
jgi:uncharacterized protein (TIGR02594 family)